MLELTVNGRTQQVDVEPEMPLLWVLRDHLGLLGAKYGCGVALCGACTVHLDGEAVRSCVVPVPVVVAIDSGHVANPDTCRAVAESNVVFGAGAVLYQENNVKKGRIVEANFNDYRLLQISEMPEVETVLVPTGGFWGGHGEPAILPLAPAVCNAIYAATGKRVRSLPLKHHDFRAA